MVEIKIIEIVCERSLREGDRQALRPSMELNTDLQVVAGHIVMTPSPTHLTMQNQKVAAASRDWTNCWLECLINSPAYTAGIGSALHDNCTPSQGACPQAPKSRQMASLSLSGLSHTARELPTAP